MAAFPYIAGARVVDSIMHNGLYLPGKAPTTEPVQYAIGQQLIIGAVLGQITLTGQYILSVKTATDGSQVPSAVAVEPVDTTATGPGGLTAVNGTAILNGQLNASALTIDPSWGATIDLAWAAVQPALRNVAIFGRFPGYSG